MYLKAVLSIVSLGSILQSNDLLDVLFRIKDSIVALDNDCNITYVNQSYADIFGLNPSRMVGKNVWKVMPKAVGSTVHTKVMEAMETRVFQRFEWQGIYTNRFWETTIFCSEDGLTVINKDITERKKAEEALLYSNQRLELISTIANQLLSSSNPQTLIQGICEKVTAFLNCAVFFNYLVDDPEKGRLHLNAYSGVPPQVAKNLEWLNLGQAACGYAIKEGRRVIWENMFESDDERTALLRSSGVKAYAANPFFSRNKVVGCLSFGSKYKNTFSADELSLMAAVAVQVGIAMERKITEAALEAYSKNLEIMVDEKTRQLRDSERLAAIGATAGMVGHDIRNPLQAMVSDAYLLREELVGIAKSKTKERIAESIESMERNITYINKIVADLQDYARPLAPEFFNVNLHELVTSVLAPIPPPENITTKIQVNPRLGLKSDPLLLRRILTNLITNATQAMSKGGTLTIHAKKNNAETIIAIEDTGVGIPEEVKPKLFAPMMTTKAKGQGLGLAVVKRLVEALNGSVSFESQVGKGTKFFITLPNMPKQ